MHTLYLLKDKNGETIFASANTACFAEIFTDNYCPYFCPKWKSKDISLEFLVDPDISKENIELFLKKCQTLSLIKAELQEVTVDNFVHSERFSHGPLSKYKIVVKRSDYRSEHLFKFAIHLLRPLIEWPDIFKHFVKPVPRGMDYFQWYRIQASLYGSGHNTFGGLVSYDAYYNGGRFVVENVSFPTFIMGLEDIKFGDCMWQVRLKFNNKKELDSTLTVEKAIVKNTIELNKQNKLNKQKTV